MNNSPIRFEMKPIHHFWTDFDMAYSEKNLANMKYVMFDVEDAIELSISSSYTWELYNALHKMGELVLKYEKLWDEE